MNTHSLSEKQLAVQRHVQRFLSALDATMTIEVFVKSLAVAVTKHEPIRMVVNTAGNWVDSQHALLERMGHESSEVQPVDVEMVLLGVWLIQSEAILTDPSNSASSVIERAALGGTAEFHRFAATIENDFLATLFIEVRARETVDSAFKARLVRACDDMRRLTSKAELSEPFANIIARRSPATIPRIASRKDDRGYILVVAIVVFIAFAIGFDQGADKVSGD